MRTTATASRTARHTPDTVGNSGWTTLDGGRRRAIAVLGLAAMLALVAFEHQAPRSPLPDSAPQSGIEDWRGNSARLR